jgi:hypothetical protein
MSNIFTIDRIEGTLMIVINQETQDVIEVPHALAPTLKEGDVFSVETQPSAQQSQLDDAQARLDRLKAKSQQPSRGDIIDL